MREPCGGRRTLSQLTLGAATILVATALAVVAGGRIGTASAASAKKNVSTSGVVTMAEGAQGTPNNIMPFVTGQYNSLANTNLEHQMWPTLFTLGTARTANKINGALSLAKAPVYSDGNTQVSVTLKRYTWSDGAPVTARDVTFFMNLLKANKTHWADYTPGDMPDNVVSWTTKGTRTVLFKLNKAYNPTWFTDNELAFIVPLPQQAWDKESLSGAVGTYDTTASGAQAVYNFLTTEGQSTSTYDTNPLWQVVDGPWKLKKMTSNGFVALVPNTSYSGPDKPKIAEFKEEPFTSSTAEFNAVLSGAIDIGYVPLNQLAEQARAEGAGYKVVRSELMAFNMLSLNYNSPVIGPLVKQLYIRKALNDVMDQPAQLSAILDKTGGFADYGPIPPLPKSQYMASIQAKNPYSPSAARKLLTSHGWKIPSTGAAVCERAGNKPSECGPGIKRGKKLQFALEYETGSGYLTSTMANFKSDASRVGIVLNLSEAPFTAIVGQICGNATCDSPGWQIANWGAGFARYYASPYPEGASTFEGHLGLDYPVTSKFSALLNATETATGSHTVKAMKAYDAWVVKHDIEVWQLETYTVNAVSKKLAHVAFNPVTGNVAPEDFVLKK